MRMHRIFAAGVLFFLSLAVVADEGHKHQSSGEKLGTVKFPTSCSKSAQKDIERGVAMLHSFWYNEAETTFSKVAAKNRDCAMAHWGIAMTLYKPLWAPPTANEVQKANEALAKTRAARKQTPRERAYIDALAEFFNGYDVYHHGRHAAAYASAMEKVQEKYPADVEAKIFYALALRATAAPTDKTYAVQKKVGAMLEPLFAAQPQHPGLAHYIIHTYDYPTLAERGLDAARRYAKIAPSSPHALHMPSHIFIRLGLWPDAIASNIASAEAAKQQAARTGSKDMIAEQLHAMDYMMYAHLQRGEDLLAKQVQNEMQRITNVDRGIFSASYAAAAIPARYVLETRRWVEAAALPEPPAAPANVTYWTDVANAITYHARALGAARMNRPTKTAENVAKLEAIRDRLIAAKRQDGADQVEIMRLEAGAWLALTNGEQNRAVELMRSAADLEDRTDKHPVTPGAVLPAREQLADILLELSRGAEALKEYEASLRTSPNRFNGLYGAARAAETAGERAKARQYYSKLLEIAPQADPERVRQAKASLANLASN
jgi:hypothetical protein